MNAVMILIVLVTLGGCTAAVEDDDGEVIDSGSSALVAGNALSHNALSHNALSHNALSHNALSHNALSPAVRGVVEASDADGELFRSFLRYAVSCAFSPTQSYAFSWRDSLGTVHDEVYPGELGLAPGWATSRLAERGQELVSACLAARTNWYGVQVLISMRSNRAPLRTTLGTDEYDEYDQIEGAFWGNVFSRTPHLSACYKAPNVENSRAALRDCAAGHVSETGDIETCGMIAIVGRCGQRCGPLHGSVNAYYNECGDEGAPPTVNVITTALP